MNYLAILRLLFRHFDDVQSLVELIPVARAVIAGPGWVANRSEPAKRIIDVTFPIADELEESIRSVSVMTPLAQREEEAKLVNNALTLGIAPSDLLQLAQLIWAIIDMIQRFKSGNVSASDSIEVE